MDDFKIEDFKFPAFSLEVDNNKTELMSALGVTMDRVVELKAVMDDAIKASEGNVAKIIGAVVAHCLTLEEIVYMSIQLGANVKHGGVLL